MTTRGAHLLPEQLLSLSRELPRVPVVLVEVLIIRPLILRHILPPRTLHLHLGGEARRLAVPLRAHRRLKLLQNLAALRRARLQRRRCAVVLNLHRPRDPELIPHSLVQ